MYLVSWQRDEVIFQGVESCHCLGPANDQLKQKQVFGGQMFYISFEPPVLITASRRELDQGSHSMGRLSRDHVASATKGARVLSFPT